MTPELKPCPFCGEQPEIIDEDGYPACIYCSNDDCNMSVETIGGSSLIDVVEIWNNRK